MLRNVLEGLFDRSRYRMVSGFEYRVSGLALVCLGVWFLHELETLSDWLLATGIVLYGLGFVKKRQCEGNGKLISVPDKSLFVFFWLFFFGGLILMSITFL
jgi:hypothetical protein